MMKIHENPNRNFNQMNKVKLNQKVAEFVFDS